METFQQRPGDPPTEMPEGILGLLGKLHFLISEVLSLSDATCHFPRLVGGKGRARGSKNGAGIWPVSS